MYNIFFNFYDVSLEYQIVYFVIWLYVFTFIFFIMYLLTFNFYDRFRTKNKLLTNKEKWLN